MVASYCAPLGIGNDLTGSARYPAASNGIFCLKPTSKRSSTVGNVNIGVTPPAIPGPITAPYGLLGKSAEDVKVAFEATLVDENFKSSPDISPIPFN